MQGTSFGKYRLLELLGRGGMGEVWRAYDTVIDRVVAIKILPPEISQDPVFQQRFRREAHAAAGLNSPHVIPIHTHGEINGRLFVDMRLIEGRDLQSILAHGPIPAHRAVRIIEQIARALQAAHKAGLLHRDVKPSNILLDDDDFAYLIDFGIARAAGELGLTAAGDVIGTFHYMAPERFGNAQVDARSDIYSLACVLYECLTAQHPFPGDSLEQQVHNHIAAPPPRPSDINPGVSRSFDLIIAKGMAKNPAERYTSAVELARAAQDAVTGPISIPAPSVPRQTDWGQRPPQDGSPATVQTQAPRSVATADPKWSGPHSQPGPAKPLWRRRPVVLSITAALAAVVILTGVAVAVGHHHEERGNPRQSTLPFTDLREPQGVSVDYGGTVYVADTLHNRVLALPAGSTSPAQLPFTGLNYPTGVTADNSGTVYVTDAGNERVLVLPAGSNTQTELPFTDLGNPTGVTVDGSRTVYVTDTEKNRVVSLPAGSNRQTELPFSGLNGPTGVVVDNRGTVYVADSGNNRILALTAGSTTPAELPFTGLKDPGGVTVDREGAVYVTDSQNNRTLKLPAGSSTQEVLPFTGLDYPWGLAVDGNGTVYVSGHGNQVVTLRQE
ncbi:Transmembrane serine/threonine-protein kinase D PknD (protein kinase D) (STPK D) [Mycobacterium tuberculosis H37Rv] [Mycobacterium shimoidei]|uniref:non-specific serine/threonine protein kinase n=1 Tax=Mycobacterium shimoidei TaxID=29313 RepID=A0A375Z0S6_MYCSH|nr:serine/threonine-protein kinase PknD [Mycobacterium shimoidei]SRX94774.1 Transmembrane serine/threonine-protein kinase D PknD (protein kinase D) (STPK D) [Mycobacterium tuberculosis H37Rv] [Mycobacterium shimoidei]